MPRDDLLHLTADDLAALTNRGTVKRAQRELEANEVAAELAEEKDGTVSAKWSDGVACTLPGGKVIADARCTCPATELCRHVVRTVLEYQQRALAKPTSGEGSEGAAPTPTTWDPGSITDEELAKHFRAAALTQARTQFQKGLLVELVRSHKPTARFHDLACTLRFQVNGDPRYVHCDCADSPPCAHVPLAVWAFRKLPPDKDAGILATQDRALPVPVDVLDQIEAVLLEGAEAGLAGAGSAWRDRLARVEQVCRDAALVWPAEVVAELIHDYERYAEHDARFDPEAFAARVGELLIRTDTIRADTGAVPQLLVRGTAADHSTDLGSARFIGVGCGVRVSRREATVVAYLQDSNSGSLVAVSRAFPDPLADSQEALKPFWQLAAVQAVKGATFTQLGAGQLLTSGGKRATNHELVLGRTKAAVSGQNFAWESLRPPAFAETFAEVRSRLSLLPPATLRPRRVGEDFHVVSVAKAEAAAFRPDTQSVDAVVVDAKDERALVRHAFTSRGAEGAERLLARLNAAPDGLRFVAGPMRLAGDGLLIEPVALVWDGPARTAVQPWVDRLGSETSGAGERPHAEGAPLDPLAEWLRSLVAAVGGLFVTGLRRADAGALRAWRDLDRRAEQVGLARLGAVVHRIAAGLAEKTASAHWEPRATARALLAVAVLARAAQEVGV